MEELQPLSKNELEVELKKAEDSLEDLREERQFTLGQTGVHIGASRVDYLRHTWEKEENALLDRIERIKARLKELE